MTGRILCNSKRLFLSLLILLGFSGTVFSFQTKVNGVINKYGRVTGIGADYVIVNDPAQFSQFSVGDTVLVIQMKGAQAIVPESAFFGNLQTAVGSPGKYEFLIITSINGALKKIVFSANLVRSYDVTGDVQIIKTPSYNSVMVDADLTSAPWDSVNKIGGVLTMIVGRTVNLGANIDVTGKGFLGGGTVIGLGICVASNSTRFDKYLFDKDSLNSGFKGESPVSKAWLDLFTQVPIFPSYSKGKGPNFSGGGGGNGSFSGGGGGAGYGAGGRGGREIGTCFPPYVFQNGGLGGYKISLTGLDGGIFFGSGGGSSTYFAGSTPSPGGNGGGIIIILCDTLIGNGHNIRADGATPSPSASGNAGAGGGGGGGSVALYLSGFSTSNITLSANGGNGGNPPGAFGEGGGGGGGLIWINNITIPGNVSRTVDLGNRGSPNSNGTPGNIGNSLTNFVAVLNGFLFNSIRSSVTGDQTDSICSNMIPKPITGTSPVGGIIPYTFLWQSSSVSEFSGYSSAPGTNNGQNYSPVLLTQTTWFRRVVTDNGAPALSDTSKAVKIIVQPFIKNNIIGTSDTICFVQDPPGFTSKAVLIDGNGKYAFKWQVSLNNSLFSLPVNTYNTEGYTPPPALMATSWYRRTITSGRCIDSTAIVKITVLDTISNNRILNTPPDICYGMIFTDLSATTTPALAGGDNSYRYKWESSINGTTWVTATGASNGTGYNPDELSPSFPGNEYYRRIVYSGMNDVCVNNSTPVLLKDFPVITNNTITANQTICSGSAPAKLIGSIPLNGNGIYTYTWQDSTKSHPWTDIPGAISITIQDYQPPALTDTTGYRRKVFSSACSDISNSIIINVHKPIATNNIFLLSAVKWDTTICSGATPRLLKGSIPTGGTSIPGDYAYEWESSASKTTGYTAISGATGKDYQPGALTVPTYYRRKAISGTCAAYSDSVISIIVLPLISNNSISTSKITVCKNSVPALLTGSIPSGGAGAGSYLFTWRESPDGITWTNASGPNPVNSRDYQPPALTTDRKYKRIVRSGSLDCCIDSSGILIISIDQLPTGSITTITDTTVCSSSAVPVKIHLTGTPNWRLIYAENGVQTIINKIQAVDTTLLINRTPAGAFSSSVFKIDSLKDSNQCVALPVTLTGTRKINIYRVPKSVAGAAADTCGPAYRLKALKTYGSGKWTKTSGPGVAAFVPDTVVNSIVYVDSTTAAWSENNLYTFKWKEINWQCSDSASVNITFYKRTGLANAGTYPDLYSFDHIDTLHAAKPLAGTGLWTGAGGIIIDNPGDSVAVIRGLKGSIDGIPYDLLWTVTNGACVSMSHATIKAFDLIIPKGFSPDNGDTLNNKFVIRGINTDPAINQISLRIVNSAGSEVFFTSNIDGNIWTDWNGENSKGLPLPDGTYYYLLTVKSGRDSSAGFKKGGFLVLKRRN